MSSLYLIFSILVRRCFASLYKRQWPIFIVSWIHFFSRMAPGLDKLMWLLTINITHLFQKMSSFVSEIDTKIFCRIIFRQNDAWFFVHNWKKDLEEKQKRMQRKRSFLIDRCALRIELIQVKLEVFAFKVGYFLFPTFTTFTYLYISLGNWVCTNLPQSINVLTILKYTSAIVIANKLVDIWLQDGPFFLDLKKSIFRMNKKVG